MEFQQWWFINRDRPQSLLIRGDHLFLNYKNCLGQRWLINPARLIHPDLTLLGTIIPFDFYIFQWVETTNRMALSNGLHKF